MANRLNKDMYFITSYAEFKEAFIEPTKLEWIHDKFIGSMPKIRDYIGYACHWYKDEPMTQEKYEWYLTNVYSGENAIKEINHMNRLHSMTNFGHYLLAWTRYFKWMFTTSYKNYRDQEFDNEFNYWCDIREERRSNESKGIFYDEDPNDSDDSLYDIAREYD